MKLLPQVMKLMCPIIPARRKNSRHAYISLLRKYGTTSKHIFKKLAFNFIGQKYYLITIISGLHIKSCQD
jgi:hypothetical protein